MGICRQTEWTAAQRMCSLARRVLVLVGVVVFASAGSAVAAPENRQSGTFELVCPAPVGVVTVMMVSHTSTKSFHISGSQQNIRYVSFSGLLSIDGGEPFPFAYDTPGARVGLQDDLITCTLDDTLVNDQSGQVLTFIHLEAQMVVTPRG